MDNVVRRSVLAIAALFVLVSVGRPPDQLTQGEFDQSQAYYRELLMIALHEGYANNVRARVLITSVLSENLIGVRKVEQGFQIFTLRPEPAIWWYETLRDLKDGTFNRGPNQLSPQQLEATRKDLEATLPRDVRDVLIEKCVAPISRPAADSVIGAWTRVLSRAKETPPPDERDIVLDGANFHFWVGGVQVYAGHVYAPDDGWPSNELAGLGNAMYQLCKSPTPGGERELERFANSVR